MKGRAYGGEGCNESSVLAARYTLHKIMRLILKLLSPIMPFVTDYLWRSLYSSEGVHYQRLTEDELEYREGKAALIEYLVRINSAVWKYKKQNGIKFSAPLPAVLYIPEEALPIADDLRRLHKIDKIIAGKPTERNAIELENNVFLVPKS